MKYDLQLINQNLSTLFSNNPLYTPYVGNNYRGILLIGESHYIDYDEIPKDNPLHGIVNNEYVVKIWGTEQQRQIDSIKDFSNYYNTKHVINEFFKGKETDSFYSARSYIFFRHIDKVFENKNINISWDQIAFMNFYQIPALCARKSVHRCTSIPGYSNLLDKSIAVVNSVLDILKPKIIIITAKHEYYLLKSLLSECSNTLDAPVLIRCTHPSCYWWNRKSGSEQKSGETRFYEALKSSLTNLD